MSVTMQVDNEDLLLYIIKQLRKVYGKKSLQKIVYFMIEQGVPLNYTFRWWTFGPYSKELDIDIDYLIAEQKIFYDPSENPPLIMPTASFNTEYIAESIKRKISEVISDLMEVTTDLTPSRLKLAAMIHFLIRYGDIDTSNKEDILNILIQKLRHNFVARSVEEVYRKMIKTKLIFV